MGAIDVDLTLHIHPKNHCIEISVIGSLINATAHDLDRLLRETIRNPQWETICLDLSQLGEMDTAGAIVLLTGQRLIEQSGRTFQLLHLPVQFRELIELVVPEIARQTSATARHKPTPILDKIGSVSLLLFQDMRQFFTFVGEFTVEILQSLRRPARVRWKDVFFYMERAGVDAIPIVSLLALLLGLILAFQAAIQLRQFGANIFVADLVGVSITRELGPLIAAIIVAGRSGSAFAAEIGTMKVSEEVAALEIMGFNPMRFLVIPKVMALLIMLPCLTLLANTVGILGGLIVGILQLDLSVTHYIQETRQALMLTDIVTGVIKSGIFAVIIAGIGCFRGLQVTTDAESVGRYTTSAVVSGIFFIILSDAAFTVMFYILGI